VTNSSNIYYSSGNVGINTATPSNPLDVSGNISLNGSVIFNNGTFNDIVLSTGYTIGQTNITTKYNVGAGGSHSFTQTNGVVESSLMTIDSTSVKILQGTASTSTDTGALIVTGGVGINGDVNAITYNTTSDYRIKENIMSLHDLSFNIDNLRPIHYTNNLSNHNDCGFIAHEVHSILPFLVNGEKDGEQMQTLNYIGLIAILTKEIQELKHRGKKMEENIEQLNDEIRKLSM
jgi:hypothetical protein